LLGDLDLWILIILDHFILVHILVLARHLSIRHVKFSKELVDVECLKGINDWVVLFEFSPLFMADMVDIEDFVKQFML